MHTTDNPNLTQIVHGNLLDIESGIIAHQVNCKGVMGAGLAKQIRLKYPIVYQAYIEWYCANILRPGLTQFVTVCNI